MAVTLELSEEVEAYLRAEVARGAAADEAELVAKAVELYRELRLKHDELRSRIDESLAQYVRGDVRPLDTLATQSEARRRFFQSR